MNIQKSIIGPRLYGIIVMMAFSVSACSQEIIIPQMTVDTFLEYPPGNQYFVHSVYGQLISDSESYFLVGEQNSITLGFDVDQCVSDLESYNVSIVFVPEDSFDAESATLQSYIHIDYVEFDDPENFIICSGA